MVDVRAIFRTKLRRFLVLVSTVVLLILCWLGVEVFFALTAKPNPVVDYGEQLESKVRELQAGRQGADVWPVLIEVRDRIKAIEAEVYESDDRFDKDKVSINYRTIETYESDLARIHEKGRSVERKTERLNLELEIAQKALELCIERGVFDRLDEVAASGVAVMPHPDSRDEMLLGQEYAYPISRTMLAWALKMRMRLAGEAGDWGAFLQAFEQLLGIGRVVADQPSFIFRSLGLSIRSDGIGEVLKPQLIEQLDPGVLHDLMGAMDRQNELPPMSHAMETDLLLQLDTVQWTHSKHGRLILYTDDPGQPRLFNVAAVAMMHQAATEQWFRDFTEEYIEFTSLTPAERRKQMPEGPGLPDITWRTKLQYIMEPSYGPAIFNSDKYALDELGLRVQLAVELHRHEQGGLPASLSDLVPHYIQSVPVDIHSPGSEPLRYFVLSEADEFGRDYLLYSVGGDGIDDGGVPLEYREAALRENQPGSDYIINHAELPD